MRWQHGQMVQGTPRVQNHESTTSGSPKAGLQALPLRCVRKPPARLGGHLSLPESRTAGHSGSLQTTERPGFRGPLHGRRKHSVLDRLELGHEICVTKTPAYQSGNGREKQFHSGQWHNTNHRRFCCEREISRFPSRWAGQQTRKGKILGHMQCEHATSQLVQWHKN